MNPVRPRGAFLSPLFGYRFMSLEPSANVRPIGQQIPAMPPASSEEADGEEEGAEGAEEDEEGIVPVANEHQPIPATFSNYDPLFYGPEQKRNFYTHIWRDIVQRMPAYRSHHSRAFQSANGVCFVVPVYFIPYFKYNFLKHRERLLEKRNPADRMHAIRMG
jgi:hypothetical protein